jgi:predicted nucleotidyltransferase
MVREPERLPVEPAGLGRIVEELCPEAVGVWLFGSFADGTPRADSDVDVAILPDRRVEPVDLWMRAQRLAQVLKRDVDLVDLLQASTVLRFLVVTDGERLAARDPVRCDFFETTAMSMYQDLNYMRREHLAEIQARGTIF